MATEMAGEGGGRGRRVQRVLVMRHGDRADHAEPMWVLRAARPWDPPLTEAGRIRAWTVGKRIRCLQTAAAAAVDRVLVSPFLRCLQTAAEAVSALCAVVDPSASPPSTPATPSPRPSRLKVSIEYGLCEMLNTRAMGPNTAPVDGKWFPEISELEAVLPAGTIDHSVEPVYEKMPQWEESVPEARNRFASVIQVLADKYPHENLLLVTHGEAIGVSISYFKKDAEVFDVEYCAFSHLEREITFESEEEFTAGNFKVVTKDGQTGIRYTYSTLD
ncbi:hypothetical protein ACMD2_16654 [Ananas comosus]|uniref:Uncharacterized protein n=1 Tax=Ananas comosus TaxID=4615 RepID=A0A199UNP4_ANACO|nr:hypothetical protein ACMD2_16654 [Ananas comosus]